VGGASRIVSALSIFDVSSFGGRDLTLTEGDRETVVVIWGYPECPMQTQSTTKAGHLFHINKCFPAAGLHNALLLPDPGRWRVRPQFEYFPIPQSRI